MLQLVGITPHFNVIPGQAELRLFLFELQTGQEIIIGLNNQGIKFYSAAPGTAGAGKIKNLMQNRFGPLGFAEYDIQIFGILTAVTGGKHHIGKAPDNHQGIPKFMGDG